MSTEAEIICRRDARLAVELFDEEAAKLPEELRTQYWESVRQQVLLRCPLPASNERNRQPMLESEAVHFENTPMPWGQFAGIPIGVVHERNPDYLHWATTPDQFKTDLVRYLASDRARRLERDD